MFFLTSKAVRHRSWVRGWLRRCHVLCVNGDSCFCSLLLFFPLTILSLGSCSKRQDVRRKAPAFSTENNSSRNLLPLLLLRPWFPFAWSLSELAGRGQCGHEGWWLRGAEQCRCAHEWHSVPIASVVMQKVSCARKSRGAGWERLLKITLPSGKHDWGCSREAKPRAQLLGLWVLGGNESNTLAVDGLRNLACWPWQTRALLASQILSAVCVCRSGLSCPGSLSDFLVPDKKA